MSKDASCLMVGCNACDRLWRYPEQGDSCPHCHGIPAVADLLRRVADLERQVKDMIRP